MLNYEFPPVGGGGAPVTYELCRELVSRGHEVDVVTMHARGTKRFEIVDGINVYRVPALRKKTEICYPHEMLTYVISAFFFCLRLTKKKRYNIMHVHFIFPTGILAYPLKLITKIPLIVTAHGSDVPFYNPERFRFLHRLMHPLWQLIVRRIDTLVAPSKYMKYHIQKFTSKAVEVIPNGFRMGNLRLSSRERKILIVSRIFRRKGVQYFLEAIKDMDLDWEIVIAGDGPYLSHLKKQAEVIKPRVNFVGFVQNEQLRSLYETSSIFIFTSQNESFGVVLLEAMSAGLAIITTNVSALPEVVENTALLVEPNNPQQIRTALDKLIHDESLIRELGDKGRERARIFNWPRIAEQYEELYTKTISNGVKG